MAVRTITTKLALDGEAEYRSKIKNINAELSLHKSELAKVQAQYQDSANSLEGLKAKQSAMQAQLSALGAKHKEQADMVEKAREAYQKYAQEAEALQARQDELKNSSSASAEEEKKLSDAIAAAEEKMQQAANSVTFYQKQLNTTERDQANLSAELAKTKTYLAEAQISTDGCARSIDQYGKEVKEAEGTSAEYQAKLKSLNADFSLHKSELAKIQAQYKDSANSLDALEAKQSAMRAQLDTLNKKHAEQAAMVEKANAEYLEYGKLVKNINANIDDLKNSTAASVEEEQQLQQALNKAQEGMDKAANSVTLYKTQLNNTERDQANLNAALEQTSGYLDEARASADGCATSIDQYGKEVKQAAEETEELGDKGASAVNALAQALVAAGIAEKVKEVTAALYDCVDTFAAFQAQMSTVQAISGATAEDMAALSEKAKAMGASTSFTAAEAGQAMEAMAMAMAMEAMAMAGWKTEDMLDGLEGVMHLAAASGESLASTSDIVTDALTAFGLAASDSGHFADVLAAASANANTNVSMMGETFQYAAPVAGALGYSIEDVALAVGLMANAGIKGSSAGTVLRTTLTNLSKPSSDIAAYMEKLGISLTDNQGNMRSLSSLLGVLRDRFNGLTEAQKAEYAAGIAGKEAMSGLLAIVNASEADYQKLEKAIAQCNNAAYEMSQVKLDNYAGQITLLSSAVDGLKLAVGEQLEPLLANIASGATTAVSGLTELLEVCPGLSSVLAGLVTSVGMLTAAMAGFSIVKAITPLIATFNAALAANPMGLFAIAAAGVVTALAAFTAQSKAADEGTKKLTKSLKESKTAYEELTAAMEEEKDSTSASVKALKELLAVENKSEGQKEAMARIVDQLNEAVPELGLAYDAAADSINMTSDALERMTQTMADQDEHNAQVERLSELYTEQQSITDQLAETQERLDEAMANAQWDSFGGAMNEAASQVSVLQENVESLTAAQADAAAQITALEESVGAYSQQQADAVSPTQEMEDRLAALCKQCTELEAAYQENYAAAMESIQGQIGLFQEMDGTAKTSIDSLIETLAGQVTYMETYAKNIQKAMEMGVDQGLIRKLSDGSEESAQILAAIVQGGEEDIKALNEQLAKVEEGKQTFSGTIAEMETDFNAKMEGLVGDLNSAIEKMNVEAEASRIGWNNIQGLIDGTAKQKQALIRKYEEMGRAAIAAYKKAVDQHSPSKKFFQAGSYDIQGIIQGAESKRVQMEAAYKEIAQSALESMERNMPRSFLEPQRVFQNEQANAIAAAVERLGERKQEPSNRGTGVSASEIAAAVREALSGVSVNMNQRKVGELVTNWQDRNNKSRGV